PRGFDGIDGFEYTLVNGLGESTARVELNVNYPGAPEAEADAYDALMDERLAVPAPGVLANDVVNAGVIEAFDAVSAQGGAVALADDGSFTYDPPAGFTGRDSFTYRLANPLGPSGATVVIDVRQRPVAQDDGPYPTPLDTSLAVGAAAGVLANDAGVPSPSVDGFDA